MSDGSTPVAVNIDPGEGEGGTVGITKLVTVAGGSLTRFEGERVGGRGLVSGKDETPVGGNDGISVSGKDEISVGGEDGVPVGGKDGVPVGGNDEISVSGKDEISVGGKDEISVGGKDERSATDRLGVDMGLDKGGREYGDVRNGMEVVVPVGVEVGKIVSSEEDNDGREKKLVELGIVMENENRVTGGDSEVDILDPDGETVELESEG